jgi:F-type H+-transporting ATPase subunit O
MSSPLADLPCCCPAACQVNKKILGGFILEFEDRLVDMSVSKKLEEFNNLVFKLEGDLRV